jgi:type IV pilus assembly protein PilA
VVTRARRAADDGFSLIELAVVVLIIAVLIAIGIPTFLGAKSRSQDAKAKSLLGQAVKAERTYHADKGVYTTDNTALRAEVSNQLTFVTGSAPAAGSDQVQVTVGDLSGAATDTSQLVCLTAVSASGSYFTVRDMSKGANAGTWYLAGADSTCTTSVTGYSRKW